MRDPQEEQPESRQSRLSRSMGTLWADHTGGKSSAVDTALDDNRVRCRIEDAGGSCVDTPAYRAQAMASIASITGLKVKAFIAKHDTTTDVATETFILERPRKRL